MPLPNKWNKNKRGNTPPVGFDIIEPVLQVLENEVRDKVKETSITIRKIETTWPIHQINWQKTKYVYDMYYTYKKISKDVYLYCIQQKYIDSLLIAKWKKPGYERLCSTYVINPTNYKFNTVSICRVPYKDRSKDQLNAKDPTTGCLGCASGKNAGPQNIFGNKYGQNLAAIQIAREKRAEMKHQQQIIKEKEKQLLEEQKRRIRQQQQNNSTNDDDDDETDDDDDDDETDDDNDDDDDEDYGPTPAAGIWAGSQKLQNESEQLEDGTLIENSSNNNNNNNSNTILGNDDETDDEDDMAPPLPPPTTTTSEPSTKRIRVDD